MGENSHHSRVVPVHDLRDYFRTSIDDVIVKQGVELDPHATHYVVNLITLFARSEELYEDDGEYYGLRPLAVMLADAADAPNADHRNQTLQRIGDVALFIAGFFIESLQHRAVDVDYYIRMGGNAYQSLGDEMRGTARGVALASVYSELARKFQAMVDVLHEVRDGAGGRSDLDVMQTLDWWHKTGSQRAERLLRECGIVPLGKSGRKH